MSNSLYEKKTVPDRVIINSKNKMGMSSQLFRILLPEFEIVSFPTIYVGDIKSRRFDIIDRTISKARQDIMCQEDANVFAALEDLKDKPKKTLFDKVKSYYEKLFQYFDI